MQPLTLASPVTDLSGIKAARAAQLERLSIRTLYDLPHALRQWSSQAPKSRTSARVLTSRA